MADDAQIDINYLKSADFREVSCDGVIGGPTPNGKVWIGFYTERFPLPRLTRHNVRTNEDGSHSVEMPGEIVDGRSGLIRNLEVGVYVTREQAKTLAEWLIKSLDEHREEETNEPTT